ncbi:MAG TPA: hypothetical protein VGX48_13490 [Pyrinomonadaceae bacterium]|jgi:hypothetical protein|nr:hypothetical protein [Pyrinomonadaceae bacterium]
MIKDSFASLGGAARTLFKSWGALLLLAALFLALLASVYVFFATGVATAWQLALSALTALAAPLLFLVLQAAAAHHAQGANTFGALLRRSLGDFWKVLVVSLPLILLGVGFVYLLGKLDGWLPAMTEASPRSFSPGTGATPPPPLHWQEALVSTLRLLLLGLLLPLMAAHAWLSVAGVGLRATLKSFHRVLGRAFTPRSVLVYATGLVAFGLMPFFIIYTRTPVSGEWAELSLFGLRLALAFAFTLLGWTITLGALARTTAAPPPAPAPAAEEPARAPEGGTAEIQA